jgi:hypothetical protein
LLGIMAPKQGACEHRGCGRRLDRRGRQAAARLSRWFAPRWRPVLQSVSLRTVSIASTQGSPPVVLEIPRLPPAATGSLPAFGSQVPGAAVPLPAAPPPPPPGSMPGFRHLPARSLQADRKLSSVPIGR